MKFDYENISDFFRNWLVSQNAISTPEEWLKEIVVDNLSKNINTIIDIGCAKGRNFLPFKDKNFNLIGFDINSPEDVNKFSLIQADFKYHQCSIEDLIQKYDTFDIKWEECLVMSHGTLMYCKEAETQNTLVKTLRTAGCKNFVFHEYASNKVLPDLSPRAKQDGLGYLDLNEDNLKLFTPPLGIKINIINKFLMRLPFEERNTRRINDSNNDLQAYIHLENTSADNKGLYKLKK